jgi:hypothetical protein
MSTFLSNCMPPNATLIPLSQRTECRIVQDSNLLILPFLCGVWLFQIVFQRYI